MRHRLIVCATTGYGFPMPTRVAVIYYSATGNVHEIADAIADGAREEGAEVRVRRVAEIAPEAVIRENEDWHAHHQAHEGRGRRGDAGRPRMGRRHRLRHADALRQPRRPAQAVHRHRRRPVGGGQARRQGGHELHVGGQRARRPGVHDPRPEQRLLPLGLDHHPAGLHRRAALRGGRQPVRHVFVAGQDGADPGDATRTAGRIQGRRLARVATALAGARASA